MSERARFYKEKNLKKIKTGWMPQEWRIYKVADCGRVITGMTPSTKVKEYWSGSYPFITPTDISDTKYVYSTERKVTQAGIKKNRLIPKDSVLVTCIGSTIGKSALAYEECITNQQINAIVCKKEINAHYVYYAITFREKQLRNWSGSAAKPIIKKSLFEKFPIIAPTNYKEQQEIASVLSTIDEAIQKTNEIIATTQELKKGLMQRLLTKGIDHLRRKKTEIGEIPEEWEVVKLERVAKVRPGKSKLGLDVKKVSFISMELISEESTFTKFENRSLDDVSSYTYCKAGDILIAKITPSLENGKQGIVPDDVPNGFALATTEVFPIICKNIDRMFLFYLLKFEKFRKVLEYSMRASTGRLRVPKHALVNLKIPLPKSLEEQQEIARILLTVDEKIEKERQTKEQLEKTKKWFMQNLLTGKIRIKVN